MLYLPILSDSQKQFLELEFKKHIIIAYIIDLIMLIVLFIVAAAIGKGFLLMKISSVENNAAIIKVKNIEKAIQSKETEISAFNKDIIFLSGIKSNHKNVSDILYQLSSFIPESSNLYSLQMSILNKEIKVQGIAPERNDLLLLQNNLEASKLFSNINFPLSNFTRKNDVDFYFSASIVDKLNAVNEEK